MDDIKLVTTSRVDLIKHNASDIDVARAAWVSNYGADAREKDPKAITGLINFLYNNKHMSPFEHGSFTFFVDTPIFVAREFMRHRTFSYNEVSGRYKQLEPRFYVPAYDRPLIQHGKVGAYEFKEGSNEQYAHSLRMTELSYEQAWNSYQEMLMNGVAREVARNVLPVGIMTQFYATCNPRNLMQFLALRDDVHALHEIREVAAQMSALFKDIMPLTYNAYRVGREEYFSAQKQREDIQTPKMIIDGKDL